MGERTAEEWGRIAVSLPGWRWMPGMRAMLSSVEHGPMPACPDRLDNSEALALETGGWIGQWPDPDDPATAGCLLALAGAPHRLLPSVEAWISGAPVDGEGITSLGRAVIADVRDQWGRWPGGDNA